jgi:hypothetical protein
MPLTLLSNAKERNQDRIMVLKACLAGMSAGLDRRRATATLTEAGRAALGELLADQSPDLALLAYPFASALGLSDHPQIGRIELLRTLDDPHQAE